ncbi:hypothetical protein Ancab_026888 [Ancistrocladus abbreviatus]
MLNSGGAPRPHGAGWLPTPRVGPTPAYLVTTAVSLRLGDFLHRRFLHHNLRLLLRSSPFKDACNKRSSQLIGLNFVRWSNDALGATWSSCLYFFGGDKTGKEAGIGRSSSLETSNKSSFDRRSWTNVLLTINLLLYVAQIATQGKLMLWGAKINNLINRGQLWRLVTSSFLHANIGHLMVNCFSLNSVGPTVENLCGPRRFFAIYFISAVSSTAMSYWLCQAPAVGASGAIFGLVGSVAVFVMRHRGMVGGATQELQHIAHVIVLNMVVGLLSKGIDNWGHLGGLLGGAAASWFLGPAWRYESISNDGRRVFADRAPVFYLLNLKRPRRSN